jgi:FMN-dependent NADH-azoreductase
MSTATPTLLHIEVSPRSARSHSRTVSRDFLSAWQASHPAGRVVTRDLVATPPPFVSEAWVVGAFAPADVQTDASREAITYSEGSVTELLAADEILISTPMYNLNVPAALKAWIDQIVRVGKTFGKGPNGLEGLLKGKKARVVVASGSDFRPGTPAAGYDFLTPYLRGILGFIGISDIEFVYAHSQNEGNPQREPSLASAKAAARQLAAA